MSESNRQFKVGNSNLTLDLEWYADNDGKWSFIGYVTDESANTQVDGAGDIDSLESLLSNIDYLNSSGSNISENNVDELTQIVEWVKKIRVETFPNCDGKERYYGI